MQPAVGEVVLAYLALQLAYTFLLKHLVIVEVLAIAGGFVLRVWAGGAAIDQPISPYLYLSMIFLAVALGFVGVGLAIGCVYCLWWAFTKSAKKDDDEREDDSWKDMPFPKG